MKIVIVDILIKRESNGDKNIFQLEAVSALCGN